jgi:Spy/CpxP family protein refolding chaperone
MRSIVTKAETSDPPPSECTIYPSSVLKLAFLAAICSLGMPMRAQTHSASEIVHNHANPHIRQNLDNRIELLARYLDLNDAQRSTLKNILLERQQEIIAMRRTPAAGEGLHLDRFRATEDKAADRIRAMLNEEQRIKYDPLSKRDSNSTAQSVRVDDWLIQARP